ncbi:MAG: flagellar hook protein [Sulfurimonas sp.]|nr:MAG: flagellar hook protein [Sulfurimonas sp.]
MAVSSLGAGSGILTQDVLDQLRKADEAAQITPIDLSLANENDKKDALAVVDASMTNFIDSINEIKSKGLYNERSATITGTSVEITATAGTDIQDFNLTVNSLATKQIEQSGSFSADTSLIASGAGSVNLNVNGTDYTINYDATTTLKDFKTLINDTAGTDVNATIVQLNTGDFRLFINSANTGSSQNITITDNSAGLNGTQLTSGLTAIQTAANASFTFNGQAVTRQSNTVTDLITGLTIDLKETGSSEVSIAQNRQGILDKMDSFVSKYNSAISELNKVTKISVDSSVRGIFSGESTIKSLKSEIQDLVTTVGGGVGSLLDYGFDVDKDGVMSLDKTIFEAALDKNPDNVEAFLAGGTFTNADLTTTTLTGAFTQFSTSIESYTKFNATLDQLKTSFTDNISSLEDRKTTATQRLDSRYEILKKRYASYDAIIARLNNSSSLFTQIINSSNKYN